MNNNKKILALTLSLISIHSNAESLSDIANIALENDYQMEVLRNNYRIELEKNNEIDGNYMPQVGLTGGINEGFYEDGKNNKDYSTSTNANIGLNLNYSLYDGAESYLKSIQDNQSLLAYNNYLKYKQEVAYNISKIYYTILANEKILEVEKENEKAVQKEHDKIQNMVEVGLKTTTDLAEIQAELDLAEANILSAENNLQNSLTQLYLYTGQENIKPDNVVFKEHKKDFEDNGYEYWMKILQENNFDLKISKISQDIAKSNIQLNETEDDFKIKLNSSISSNYNNRYVDEFESQANIGIQIELPFYNGGSTDSKVKQARINYANSFVKHDLLNRQLTPQLKIVLNELKSMDRQIAALAKSVDSSKKSLDVVQESYNVGIRDIVDVLDANTQYYVSLKNLSNAEYDYLFKQNELLYITGMLDGNNI